MKPIIVVLLAILMITLSTKALSQEEPRNRFGVGISLDPGRIGQTYYYTDPGVGGESSVPAKGSPIMIYLPIYVLERFRVEPCFGLFSNNSETTTASSSTGYSQRYISSNKFSSIEIGLRTFYLSPLSSSFSLYFGPRLGLIFLSSTTSGSFTSGSTFSSFTSEFKETDVAVGGIFGSEFFPLSEFSVGGECGLNYISFGNPKTSGSSNPPPIIVTGQTSSERKQHVWRTDVLFFVRWYFL